MQTAMNTTQRPQPIAQKKDQNSHIRTGTEAYIRCIDWLMVKGFVLTKVEIGDHALPVIHIQTGGLCNLFKERYNAVCYGFRGEHGVRVDTWRAEVFGCRVEWVERGH